MQHDDTAVTLACTSHIEYLPWYQVLVKQYILQNGSQCSHESNDARMSHIPLPCTSDASPPTPYPTQALRADYSSIHSGRSGVVWSCGRCCNRLCSSTPERHSIDFLLQCILGTWYSVSYGIMSYHPMRGLCRSRKGITSTTRVHGTSLQLCVCCHTLGAAEGYMAALTAHCCCCCWFVQVGWQ